MTRQYQKPWMGLAGLTLLITGLAPTLKATELKFNKYVDEVSIKGDIRLRQENFNWTNKAGQPDRQRQRVRLRLGIDAKLPNNISVKTRLATSEDQDQVSSNQTMTNNANPKGIYLDRAYLTWAPADPLSFQGGKIANPFWQTYASDIMWDTDYNPEGLSQSFSGLVGPAKVFVNTGQFAINERKTNLKDAYQFSEQIGTEFKLPLESRFTIGLAHHEFVNLSTAANSTVNDNGGKDTLKSQTTPYKFSIMEVTGALSSWIGKIPVALEGTYLKNTAASKSTVNGNRKQRNTGSQYGIKVGANANPGDWQVAFFLKSLQKDAAIAGITDSDWEGVNRRGYVGWVSYVVNEPVSLQAKYFSNKLMDVASNASKEDMKRLQCDLVVKF